jgi:hypothetical protein
MASMALSNWTLRYGMRSACLKEEGLWPVCVLIKLRRWTDLSRPYSMIILTDNVVNKQHIKRAMKISLSLLDTMLTERECDITNQIHEYFHNKFRVLFQNKGSCTARWELMVWYVQRYGQRNFLSVSEHT